MSDIVLITGGLGYIGGRVARKLVESSNYDVLLGTRQPVGVCPGWIKNARTIRMDILSERDLNNACTGVHHIIHLAALNEVECAANPENAFLVNSLGTMKLVRAATHAGVKRFIYMSTAHIYGSPLAGKITEKTIPRPIHPYAITHKAAEDFVLAANDSVKFEGLVLRLSNSFGAPAHPDVNRWMLVVNDLCRQAVLNHQLVLNSSGIQKRDFVSLSDVTNAVLHFLNLPKNLFDNGIFNLGGENTIHIIDMAEKVKNRCSKVLGYTPSILRPGSNPNEESPYLNYTIDKLKRTGFSLINNMDEEIDATLELCKKSFGNCCNAPN